MRHNTRPIVEKLLKVKSIFRPTDKFAPKGKIRETIKVSASGSMFVVAMILIALLLLYI